MNKTSEFFSKLLKTKKKINALSNQIIKLPTESMSYCKLRILRSS